MTKPAAQAAKPEKLLSKAITTGISAPPIGITNNTPSMKARTISKTSVSSEEMKP